MNINEYPVNFGYLEKTTINGVPYTHRGNDYPLSYEPVKILGNQIGVSGATGLVSGPHTHVQAGRDEWAQSTIDPTPYVGKPGTVVKTGNASQWGNYVCIKVGDVNVFYCHLSRIDIQIGQVIKGDDVAIIANTNNWFGRMNRLTQQFGWGELTRSNFEKNYVGFDFQKKVEALSDGKPADEWFKAAKVGQQAIKEGWVKPTTGYNRDGVIKYIGSNLK